MRLSSSATQDSILHSPLHAVVSNVNTRPKPYAIAPVAKRAYSGNGSVSLLPESEASQPIRSQYETAVKRSIMERWYLVVSTSCGSLCNCLCSVQTMAWMLERVRITWLCRCRDKVVYRCQYLTAVNMYRIWQAVQNCAAEGCVLAMLDYCHSSGETCRTSPIRPAPRGTRTLPKPNLVGTGQHRWNLIASNTACPHSQCKTLPLLEIALGLTLVLTILLAKLL